MTGPGSNLAFESAHEAINLMHQHDVPINAQSFTVWYHYATGDNRDLKRAMEILRSNDRPITIKECSDLYDQYLGEKSNELEINAVGQKMASELDHVIATLAEAGLDTEAYGQALQHVSNQLDDDAHGIGNLPKPLQIVLEQIVQATNQMRKRTHTLEQRLEESKLEVRSLRNDLDAIRHESITDALTGLGNRRYFDQMLRTTVSESMETGSPLSLILGDIDFFKLFNDKFGHQTGDQVLKLVGACIRENVKGRDQAARYGGEEFAVILPQTDVAGAKSLAEAIRKTVQGRHLVKRSTGEDLGSITMSFGAAQFNPGESLIDFVDRADICLYAAKNEGRNRTLGEKDVDLEKAAKPASNRDTEAA